MQLLLLALLVYTLSDRRVNISTRILMYYAKLMGGTLDNLVGELEPTYKETSLDNALHAEIAKLNTTQKEKLLKTLKLWN